MYSIMVNVVLRFKKKSFPLAKQASVLSIP